MEALEGELHRVRQRLRKVSNRLKRMTTLLLASGKDSNPSDQDEARGAGGGVVAPGGGFMEDDESRYQPHH
ncbi:hypothetical protein Tco_0022746 [Tanacetum coccineum]